MPRELSLRAALAHVPPGFVGFTGWRSCGLNATRVGTIIPPDVKKRFKSSSRHTEALGGLRSPVRSSSVAIMNSGACSIWGDLLSVGIDVWHRGMGRSGSGANADAHWSVVSQLRVVLEYRVGAPDHEAHFLVRHRSPRQPILPPAFRRLLLSTPRTNLSSEMPQKYTAGSPEHELCEKYVLKNFLISSPHARLCTNFLAATPASLPTPSTCLAATPLVHYVGAR